MQVRNVLLNGDADEALEMRVRIMRYIMVSWIFAMRRLSRPILRRFKATEKLADATLRQKLAVLNFDPCVLFYAFRITTSEISLGTSYVQI